jgi:hypothetical protein
MKLLTISTAASLLALGACSSNAQRGGDGVRDSTPPQATRGTTCLPPGCTYPTGRVQTKTATSAKPTVKPTR